MTGFVEISIEPAKMGAAGQRYNVFHDGALIEEGSKDPFHSGARALLALGGAELDDTLIMHDLKSGKPLLYGRLGWAAAHATSEGNNHGPRTVKWEPFSRPAP